MRIQNTDLEIRQTSIDLGVTYPELVAECGELRAKVFGWSTHADSAATIRG